MCEQDFKQNYKSYAAYIEKLSNRINDLEQNIEAHQQILVSLLQSKSTENLSISTTGISIKQLDSILQENVSLNQSLKTSHKELNIAQSKSFLSEQIYNDVNQKINEINLEYTEKINDYKFSIETKSKVLMDLNEYNKRLEEIARNSANSKFVEISAPKEEVLNIYEKVEWMKEKIQELARTCFVAGEYKDILSDFMKKYTLAYQKIQVLLKNPINRKPGAERVQLGPLQEKLDESEESSSSSGVEVSETRSKTVKETKVPKIDFTKINRHKSVMTQQVDFKSGLEGSSQILEMRRLFKGLNEAISTQSGELEKLSKENFKLQQENVKLMKEYLASELGKKEVREIGEVSELEVILEDGEV